MRNHSYFLVCVDFHTDSLPVREVRPTYGHPRATDDLHTKPCIKSSPSPSLRSSIVVGYKEGCIAAKRPKYNNIMTSWNDKNEEGSRLRGFGVASIVALGSGIVRLRYP